MGIGQHGKQPTGAGNIFRTCCHIGAGHGVSPSFCGARGNSGTFSCEGQQASPAIADTPFAYQKCFVFKTLKVACHGLLGHVHLGAKCRDISIIQIDELNQNIQLGLCQINISSGLSGARTQVSPGCAQQSGTLIELAFSKVKPGVCCPSCSESTWHASHGLVDRYDYHRTMKLSSVKLKLLKLRFPRYGAGSITGIKVSLMSLLPFDDRDGWIWQDGEFVPWRDAKVHVLTHSLHYGSAVFEGERAYDGKVFRTEEHSRRLLRSAELLDYSIPYTAEEITRTKAEVMDRMGLENCYVRAFAWRGSEMMGVAAQNNTIHLAVAAWEWGAYFADKMKGIRVMMSQWKRPSPETIPCASKAAGLYMICTMSKHKAEQEGYADALMLDYRGFVAELTGANVFFINNGVIHTPLADCFLDGITRRTVIGLARQMGYEVVERRILPDEIPYFSEVFITGSAAEVTAVSEIAGATFKPGEITANLMEAYDKAVRGKVQLPELGPANQV